MKKFVLKMGRMVSCLVLATAMVVSGILPSMASGTDDLTDWTVGTSNTITGNPTDGWDVALDGGNLFDADTFAAYEFDGLASELQVTMDLSAMVANDNFVFQIGEESGDIYNWAWTGELVTFMVKRAGDNLDIYGHCGNAETTHAVIENFDFTVSHVFEFLQDNNDAYHLAVDGNLCLTPWASDDGTNSVDNYVTTGGTENFVTVSFLATAPVTINNMKIGKKATAAPSPTTTINPTEAPTATPDGSASATPGVPNKPTGDVSMFAIVALVLAVGAGMIVLRKKSCKE